MLAGPSRPTPLLPSDRAVASDMLGAEWRTLSNFRFVHRKALPPVLGATRFAPPPPPPVREIRSLRNSLDREPGFDFGDGLGKAQAP